MPNDHQGFNSQFLHGYYVGPNAVFDQKRIGEKEYKAALSHDGTDCICVIVGRGAKGEFLPATRVPHNDIPLSLIESLQRKLSQRFGSS